MSPYRDDVLKFTWKCGECGKMNTQRKRRGKKLRRRTFSSTTYLMGRNND